MMRKKEFLNNVSLLTRVQERKNSIIKNYDFVAFTFGLHYLCIVKQSKLQKKKDMKEINYKDMKFNPFNLIGGEWMLVTPA